MMKQLNDYFQLGNKKPDPVYRIAETAFNHEGNLPYMLKMIQALKNSGVDAVKFHVLLELQAYMVPEHSLYPKLKEWLFNAEQWQEVFSECRKNRLAIVGLADDQTSLQFMIHEQVDLLAIHASSLHDIHMLRTLAKVDQPVLIGIGGATPSEIEYTMQMLAPKQNVILMYGLQQYPTPLSSLHLTKIARFEEQFGLPVGYADHTASHLKLERAMAYAAAYALGARIFEQHVTLDIHDKRLDDESAIQASAFSPFTSFTQQIEQMIGFSVHDLKEGEQQYTHSRKQLVASRDLTKGTILKEPDIDFKRSEQQTDLTGSDFFNLIGKSIKQNVHKGQVFTSSMITGRRS